MFLHELRDNKGARKRKMTVGRGIGSGKGKTSGRGGKGQTARTGVAINGFEGGQMPLHRRMPKRGFNQPNRAQYVIINLETLQYAIEAGKIDANTTITADVLKQAGLINQIHDGLRLLAKGTLSHKVTIDVVHASETAKLAIEKAGGQVNILNQ